MAIFIVKATASAPISAGGTLVFGYPLASISGNPAYPYPFDPSHVSANPPPPQPLEQFAAGDFLSSPAARAYSSGNQAMLLEGIHFTLAYNTPIASGITLTYLGASTIPAGSLVTLQLQTSGQGDGAPFKNDSRISRGILAPVAVLRMGSPLASTATLVLNATAVLVTTLVALGSPVVLDVPRNLNFITSNAGDTTQTITVRGLDEFGNAMTETRNLNGSTTVAGLKAFKTVISYQASAALAGNLSIGSGNALGLPVPLEVLGYVIQDTTDGAKSGTQGTYTAAADNVIQTAATGDVRGTFSPNTAPNGVHAYEVIAILPDPAYAALPQYAG
jgi:hypothetical protein